MAVQSVFIVQHVAREDEDDEDVKFIGAYSSRGEARAAISRLLPQPGFRDYPEGFHIDEYQLGQDHWSEGFIAADEALASSPASRSA
jgi:hypothetical protein